MLVTSLLERMALQFYLKV